MARTDAMQTTFKVCQRTAQFIADVAVANRTEQCIAAYGGWPQVNHR